MAKPCPEETAGPERDQRLHRLEPGTLRVLPGIDEAEEARPPIWLEPDRNETESGCNSHSRRKRWDRGPRDKKHSEQDDDERDRRAEIRLGEDQEAEDAEQQADRAPQLLERSRC